MKEQESNIIVRLEQKAYQLHDISNGYSFKSACDRIRQRQLDFIEGGKWVLDLFKNGEIPYCQCNKPKIKESKWCAICDKRIVF